MLLKEHVMPHLGFFLLSLFLRGPLLRSSPPWGARGGGVAPGEVEEGAGERQGGEEPGDQQAVEQGDAPEADQLQLGAGQRVQPPVAAQQGEQVQEVHHAADHQEQGEGQEEVAAALEEPRQGQGRRQGAWGGDQVVWWLLL